MENTKCKTCGQEIENNVIQHIPEQNLEWGKISDEEMNWDDAVKWCKSQGEGWRLPTRFELIRAFDEGIVFPGNVFWSSTENYTDTAYAWYVYLSYGATGANTKVTAYNVRCVRS